MNFKAVGAALTSFALLFQSVSASQQAYFKISPGVSFPLKPNIQALPPTWDDVIEGYNSSLGTRPNIGIGAGYEMCSWGAAEVNLTYRGAFNYNKFQRPTPGAVFNTLPDKERRFRMEALTLMGSFFVTGRDFSCLTWNCGSASVYPIVGFGLGTSRIPIWDFRATCLPSNEDSGPYNTFSSENQYSLRWKFTYQVSGGIEYRSCDNWAIGVNYRWFDAGRLGGPRYFRSNSGQSFDVGCDVWKISLKANELVFDLKTFF